MNRKTKRFLCKESFKKCSKYAIYYMYSFPYNESFSLSWAFALDTSVKYNHAMAKDLCVAYRIHGKALRMSFLTFFG